MQISLKTKKYIKLLFSIILLLVCEWFFFRNILFSNSNNLIGDRGDGRLTMLLTEHWWNYVCGKEGFSELAMFHPAAGAIGYSDMFLGYGIIHCFLRLCGLDIFSAFKITVIVVHAMGTCSMLYLLKKSLKCSYVWSLFGTIAFVFSSTFSRAIAHTQLTAICFLPILLIFMIGFFENIDNKKNRYKYAILSIIWFVLLTYTSWYIACYTGIFVLLFIFIYLINNLAHKNLAFFHDCKKFFKATWTEVLLYFFIALVLYIPFIFIYIPVMISSSTYTYAEHSMYMPQLIDVINVSESNLLLGGFIKALQLSERGLSEEVKVGFSIILLCVFFIVLIKTVIGLNKTRENVSENNKVFLTSMGLTIVIVLFMGIRFNNNGVSLWWIVYHVLPVAKSLRAVARLMFWVSFPIAVYTAYMADNYFVIKNESIQNIIGLGLVFLLFISNVEKGGVLSFWDKSSEEMYMNMLTAIPDDAEVFYVVDTSEENDDSLNNVESLLHQLDAYELANMYSKKTINGYSGKYPKEFGRIWDINYPGYESDIYAVVNKYSLNNVYVLDFNQNKWFTYAERLNDIMDKSFSSAEGDFSVSINLDDWNVGEYVWVKREFQTVICDSEINNSEMKIHFVTMPEYYQLQNPNIAPNMKIYIDNQLVGDFEPDEGDNQIAFSVENHDSPVYDIKIITNFYFTLRSIGVAEDDTEFSYGLIYIGK